MTRREARWAVSAAVVLVVAGLVWLFGPWGLLGSGVVVLVVVLFVMEVESAGGEAVADSARPDRGDFSLLPGRLSR